VFRHFVLPGSHAAFDWVVMTKPTLEDILTDIAMAQDQPDAALLDGYIERYPEHADAIIDFAVCLAIEANLEP
jgi:hypothetical protein